ncbi:RHS repeat-associated core domain-containing protein [Chloroflexia bacterium SDU3-3]|nr:RHS repeat-associated core domain-containing protein [Chloroflexia bacterium SDU3-3]
MHKQEFDPWGSVRAGDVPETTLDYTGQRRDTTGLRYYNARYDDPVSGHFLSADTIVPGAGALTMAPNDSTARGLWGKGGNGPANPQELNRYSYVNNNPVRWNDPSGHFAQLLMLPLLVVSAPAWIVPALIVTGVVIVAAGVAYVAADTLKSYNEAKQRQNASNKGKLADKPADKPAETAVPDVGQKLPGSKTLYQDDKGVRVDVENPAGRQGEVHIHAGSNKPEDKYRYNPETGKFVGKDGKDAPKSVQDLLKIEKIAKAIKRGVEDYLGIK